MARVWRDGQTKPCFIYRMLTVGLKISNLIETKTKPKVFNFHFFFFVGWND